MIINANALVISSRPYGDTSRIATLYLENYGKMSVHARGALKPNSPFTCLQVMTFVNATVYVKPGRELQTLSKADAISIRKRLAFDYEAMLSGLFICELILRTQQDAEPDPNILSSALWALEAIDSGSPARGMAISFFIQLLQRMGFALSSGSQTHVDPVSISLSTGKSTDTVTVGGAYALKAGEYNLLQRVLSHGMEDPPAVNTEDFVAIVGFLRTYLEYHTERPITLRSLPY